MNMVVVYKNEEWELWSALVGETDRSQIVGTCRKDGKKW